MKGNDVLFESIEKLKMKYNCIIENDFHQEYQKLKTEWENIFDNELESSNLSHSKNKMNSISKICYHLCLKEVHIIHENSRVEISQIIEDLNEYDILNLFPKLANELKPIEKVETPFQKYKRVSDEKFLEEDKKRRRDLFKRKFKKFLSFLFPPVIWLREYKKSFLKSDIIAGLTLGK